MPSPVVLTIRPRWVVMAGGDNRLCDCLDPNQHAFFVRAHQAAVSGNVRCQNSRKSPLHAIAIQ